MSKGVVFSREELVLLHETLSYGVRRTYTGAEKVRMQDLLGRVEERLLAENVVERSFGMTEPEAEVLQQAAETYGEALRQPLAAEISRQKAERIAELVNRFRGGGGFLQTLRRLFGRG